MRKAFCSMMIAAAAGITAVGSAGATGIRPLDLRPERLGSDTKLDAQERCQSSSPACTSARWPPARPQSFYRVSYGDSSACAVVGSESGSAYFLPAAGLIRTVDSLSTQHALWAKLSSKLAVRLRQLVSNIKPYAPPEKVSMVLVGDQIAARPSSYLRLYTTGTSTRSSPNVKRWIGITLSGASTPWTDSKNVLAVASTGAYLKRDGQIVRIPGAMAKRIRQAKSISR